MDLSKLFIQHLAEHELFEKDGKFLLAVSGGMDSMVLVQLMMEAGVYVEVAHANFQLRGEDSDADEDLVKSVCSDLGCKTHIRRFNTVDYVAKHKVGIQEAARNLRYQWMLQLLEENGLNAIVTAHHQDDNIETVVMNFFKGTGLNGLTGMKEKRGGWAKKLIRPLLRFGKKELFGYAQEKKLIWREDVSNASDKYTRNFIRNELLPLVKTRFPEVESNILSSIDRFRDMQEWMDAAMNEKMKKLLVIKGEEQQMPVLLIQQQHGMLTILYNWLHTFGFTSGQIQEAAKLLNAASGSYVSSSTHRLIRNRKWLLLVPIATERANVIVIEEDENDVDLGQSRLKISKGNGMPIPDDDEAVACLDAKDIFFPLILRKWKTGDYFYPLGMNKKKKLSRFFIDKKLSIDEKEKVWILESDKRIIWVVGHRIDDRFKLKPSTNEWIRIEVLPSK